MSKMAYHIVAIFHEIRTINPLPLAKLPDACVFKNIRWKLQWIIFIAKSFAYLFGLCHIGVICNRKREKKRARNKQTNTNRNARVQ